MKTWAQWLKERYPAGTRIRIEKMRGKPHMSGAVCTILEVDKNGMIHADKSGEKILVYIGTDEFRVI